MNDRFAEEYARFAKEKLRPAVSGIAARKRGGLLWGLGAGLACFVIGAGAVYLLIAPYREIMNTSSVSVWPLMLLAPAALGILAFSLVFVLSLRKTVVDFRHALVGGMAEFIDPALVHESDSPIPREQVTAGHLFPEGWKAEVGSERFRGRAGESAVEFSDIRVAGDGGVKAGLYLGARYERPFPYPFFVFPAGVEVSRSGLEASLARDGFAVPGGLVRVDSGGRQYLVPSAEADAAGRILSADIVARLDEVQAANGGELYLACRDDRMYLALLAAGGDAKEGIFEAFDFDGCREFCRDARAAMEMAGKGVVGRGVTRHFLS